MTTVGPEAIYKALTAAGASTLQAIGIMANMHFESGYDPEAVGDQGTSFGLVQQHGAYSYLVTGDPAADMEAQIRELVKLGGLSAASGSTPTQAAGNFAANYERCVGCQPGGGQYESRSAFGATVAAWAASGKWPASAGSPSSTPSGGSSPGGGSGTPADTTSFDWTLGTPFADLPLLGKLITGTSGSFSSIGDVAKSITGLTRAASKMLELFALLFRPEFWLRVGAFMIAMFALGSGLYFLKGSL